MKRNVSFLLVAVAVIAFDQFTKHLVVGKMILGQSIALVKGWLALTYIRNTGIAFGVMNGWGGNAKMFFLVGATLVALGFLVWFLREFPAGDGFSGAVLGMVAGGAVGNLIDRVRLGGVIDFIDVSWRNHHWPYFNVADSCISVGVCLLLVRHFMVHGKTGGEERCTPSSSSLAP